MNGYVCFYKGKRIEVRADTSFEAQKKVAAQLKVKPRDMYLITVVLAELGEDQVTHTAVD